MARELSINIFGDQVFMRRITQMAYRSTDMSPVLAEIGDDWLDIVEEQYSTEGARGGKKWKQLTSFTVKKRKSAHPILVESGDMLIETTGRDNLTIEDDEITLDLGGGVVEDRAVSHQYGYRNALTGNDVPARPIFALTRVDREKYASWLVKYLVEGELP